MTIEILIFEQVKIDRRGISVIIYSVQIRVVNHSTYFDSRLFSNYFDSRLFSNCIFDDLDSYSSEISRRKQPRVLATPGKKPRQSAHAKATRPAASISGDCKVAFSKSDF
jgi:hypothetical protein